MKFENKFEKPKNYIEKNLESIEIRGNTIDIINGQGCLIKPETTILFGDDNEGNKKKIKDFLESYKVTSHAYLDCAEIIGEFKNGDKFYIHARNPYEFEKLLEAMLDEIENNKKQIQKIRIKSDFNRYKDEDSQKKMNEYKRRCDELKIDKNNIKIENESFIGYTPEKIVDYFGIEDNLK